MRSNELPAIPSRKVFTIGMAPPTAASKLSATCCFSASAASSTPCLASNALLAVTTDLPAAKRRLDRALGRIAGAADQFDEDIDAGIARERNGIGKPCHLFEIDAAVLAARARADRHDLDRAAAARGKRLALARHLGDQGRADRAQSGDTHFQRPEPCGLAPRGERNDVVQFFRPGFEEAARRCARPGGCAARFPPARCARSPRHIRRSRCRARPQFRPSPPAAWKTPRCRAG